MTAASLGFPLFVAAAQPVIPPANAIIYPTLPLQVTPPQLRSWADMEAAAALTTAGPARPAQELKFRPTVGDPVYQGLKAAAAQPRSLEAPSGPGIARPAPLAPLSNTINFDGVDSLNTGGFYPPDTEGVVGLNHFVEITNSHLDIYLKAAPNTSVKGVPLSSFFGYTTQDLFDPRVIYDPVFNRWVISASAFPESTTTTYFFCAVSQTADPTGAFYIYRVDVSTGNNDLWDFPQLGMDQNAIIFTANLFQGPNSNTFVDARMFAVAKSLLYNGPGQTLTPQLFTGLAGSLAPPLVLDANPHTFLVAAAIQDNKVTLYTLTNSAASPTLTASTIPVPAYTAPPGAPQAGTTSVLDTSDSRFVNAGTQIGNSLFQVHTINLGGHARPRFYEFDTVNKQIIQSGTFARSSTSYDFNASIAANPHKDVFVTWSATDNKVNAEVRFSGRRHHDPLNVISSPGSLLFGSASYYRIDLSTRVQRWGDYSAVSLDPADPSRTTAWIVNERILGTATWGSRIGRIKAPLNILPAIYLILLAD